MLQDWISAIEGWIPALADSLWVYPALTLFALVDGFFPPIPSESVVIALASLSVSHGAPHLASRPLQSLRIWISVLPKRAPTYPGIRRR